MKLLIAINENKGTDSKLSEHFGHCPYFAVYETETKKLEIIKNKIDHSNQNLTPVDQIMELSPDIVFTKGVGERAIKLKTGNYKIVKEVLDNINNLKEMEDGCGH